MNSINSPKILFLGDTFLDKIYDLDLESLTGSIPVIFNLEAPISSSGSQIPGKICLRSPVDSLEQTFKPLPLAVCLANNHIMDYGEVAFEDTIKILKTNEILYFGAGNPKENYNNPLILTHRGLKLGMAGYCYADFFNQTPDVLEMKYSPAPLILERITNDILSMKELVNRVVYPLSLG